MFLKLNLCQKKVFICLGKILSNFGFFICITPIAAISSSQDDEIARNRKQHNLSGESQNNINNNIVPKLLVKKIEKNEPINSLAGSFNYSDTKSEVSDYKTSAYTESFEEPRYNLATRIMSNGVEVIIAGDKSKPLDNSLDTSKSPEPFRINDTQVDPHKTMKPMTLAPSTLKNQMVLLVPTALKEKFAIPIHTNQFVTKTCLTTYTYRTTYLQDGMTRVESREKIIANIATEERNYPKISSILSMGVTLSRTPLLAVGVFPTTYSYFFTLHDGEVSRTLYTDHTVINTITAPDDYIFFLQPSEAATPVFDTNTYFNKVAVSKTLDEGHLLKILTNSETLTQVVVTESLPAKSTSVLTSYYAFDVDETRTKDISTKFSNHLSKTTIKEEIQDPKTIKTNYEVLVYATKSFHTTFTYLASATPLHGSTKRLESKLLSIKDENFSPSPTTEVNNYYTRVIENVITEAVPTTLLKPELVENFYKELKKSKNQRSIVTLATLLNGQTLKVTAMKMINSDINSSLFEPTINIQVQTNSNSTATFNTESTKSAILSQLPERTTDERFNPSKVHDFRTTSLKLDSDFESSEIRPAIIKLHSEKNSNLTKVKAETESSSPSPTYVNNIFGSLNLNRLTALRPVFNAMADLLQNKFTSNPDVTESKNALKNITSNIKPEINYEDPIYIPFQNTFDQDSKHVFPETTKGSQNIDNNNYDVVRLAPPQTLHIQPPAADFTISDDNWVHEKFSSDHNFMHISNKLNSPSQQPLINGGIPIRPGEIITANSDVIIGKPNGIQQPKVYTVQSNIIPLRRGHNEKNQYKPPLLVPQQKYVAENYDDILQPPPPPPLIKTTNRLPPNPQFIENLALISPLRVSGFESLLNNPREHTSNKNEVQKKHFSKIHSLNEALKNNEIIEIKRMPQIFSSDISPEHKVIPASRIYLNDKVTNQGSQNQLQLRLNSNYTNFTIYDTKLNINPFKTDYKNTIHKNTQTTQTFPNSGTAAHFASRVRPHSNHQRVSLQTNVLSHNIAINVPPLTFKKESDISTPVLHGTPLNSNYLIMPHINIPANEVEVQVNLTPQNSISQHHQYIKYFPNTVKIPTFGAFAVDGAEPQTQIPSESTQHTDSISFQNHRIVQSTQNKQMQINKYGMPNTNTTTVTKKNMADLVKPITVFKSHFPLKPTVTEEPIHNKENDSESNFKTRDQIGAFSSSKEQHFLFQKQSKNQLNKQFYNAQLTSTGTPDPLINPLSALLVNHMDEPPLQRANVSGLHLLGKPLSTTRFQTKTSDKNRKILPDLKKQGFPLLPIHLIQSSQEHEIRKKNISDVNDKTNQEYNTLSRNTVSNQRSTTVPVFKGKPFTQNYLAPDNSKKTSSSTSPNINFLIANGEGFKLNVNATLSTQNFATDKINIPLNKINEISLEKGSKNNHDQNLAPKIPKPLTNYFMIDSIHLENNVKQTETHNHISLTKFGTSFHTGNQNLRPSFESNIILQPSSRPALSMKIPLPPQTLGLNPPPLPSTSLFAKKSYTTLRNTFTKTIDLIRPTHSSQTQLISSKSYVKLKSDEQITDRYISLVPPTKSLKTSALLSKPPKSSPFALSSGINFSNNFKNRQNNIKITPVLLPKLPKTNLVNSTTPSYSDNLWNTHVITKNFDRQQDSFQIILEPSTDNFSSQLTLSNDYLPSSLINSSLPTAKASGVDHGMYSYGYSENRTLPLEHFKTIQLTKFITNTVTTTKTTVSTTTIKNEREEIQSSFKTTTFYLTTTFTTTLVDTLTEMHTLIEPTPNLSYQNIINGLSTPPVSNYKLTTDLAIMSHLSQLPYSNKLNVSSQKTVASTDNLGYNIFHKEFNDKLSSQEKSRIKIEKSNQFPDQDNIFIVMTNIQGMPNVITTQDAPLQKEDDYDSNDLEVATRDEELFVGSEDTINKILLGGVIVATSTTSKISNNHTNDASSMRSIGMASKNFGVNAIKCRPACKTSRNELCKELDSRKQCVCRPGFARMFPDRPCKPTYTYTMNIAIRRIGEFELIYNNSLSNNSSKEFSELAATARDAIDRMVMQSDFRDVYHGVIVESFSTDDTHAVIANILLQFSDMNDEKRLEEVFKKYLRVSNYNIGLTELFSDKRGAETISISDFNECEHSIFNDCSENSRCFNLKGTYTCNCDDGYLDLSENSAFPGRSCALEVVGCQKCNFNGRCAPIFSAKAKDPSIVCECFAWYSGSMCQLNLKILLIALIATGTILFVILLICILLTCMKHRVPRKPYASSVMTEIQSKRRNRAGLIGVKVNLKDGNKRDSLLKILKPHKRTTIIETSSESSDSSLPYVIKDSLRSERNKCSKPSAINSERKDCERFVNETKHFPQTNISPATNLNYYINTGPKSVMPSLGHFQGTILTEIEQSDRSLTVMIPRAKYHPSVLPQAKLLHHQLTLERTNPAIPQQIPRKQSDSRIGEKNSAMMRDNYSTGALVSAGFEVSAVVNENSLHSNFENSRKVLITKEHATNNLSSFNASDDSLVNPRDRLQYDFSKINDQNVQTDSECHVLYNIYNLNESTDGKIFGDSAFISTSGDKSDHNTNEESDLSGLDSL